MMQSFDTVRPGLHKLPPWPIDGARELSMQITSHLDRKFVGTSNASIRWVRANRDSMLRWRVQSRLRKTLGEQATLEIASRTTNVCRQSGASGLGPVGPFSAPGQISRPGQSKDSGLASPERGLAALERIGREGGRCESSRKSC
jgi:hypothetical protein